MKHVFPFYFCFVCCYRGDLFVNTDSLLSIPQLVFFFFFFFWTSGYCLCHVDNPQKVWYLKRLWRELSGQNHSPTISGETNYKSERKTCDWRVILAGVRHHEEEWLEVRQAYSLLTSSECFSFFLLKIRFFWFKKSANKSLQDAFSTRRFSLFRWRRSQTTSLKLLALVEEGILSGCHVPLNTLPEFPFSFYSNWVSGYRKKILEIRVLKFEEEKAFGELFFFFFFFETTNCHRK